MVNYALLNDKVKESGLKQSYIADQMGVSRSYLSSKLNNRRKIWLEDAKALQKILNLSRKEVDDIFFADNVE